MSTIAQVAQALRHVGVLASELGRADLESRAQERLRLLPPPETAVGQSEGSAHGRRHQGLVLERGLDLVRRPLERFADARVAPALPGVGGAQGLLEELGHRRRLLRLRLRPVALVRDAASLDRGGGREAHEGEREGGHEGHSHAVALRELARAVGGAGRARGDGLVPEVALEVEGEAVRGLVAPRAVPGHGLEHDPVEVAPERPPQVGHVGAPVVGEGLRAMGRGHARARPQRVVLAEIGRGGAARLLQLVRIEGQVAGEEQVERDPQAVDVRPRVHVEHGSLELLRAHEGGGADDLAHVGHERLVGQPPVHGLGDAEVDDLGDGLAVLDRDEDVRGLEVAVDDALLVRVLHGLAHLDEELHPLPGVEPLPVGVVGDGHAADQLHHEVRPPAFRHPRVVDAGDAGVVHEGEGLALGVEAGQHLLRLHAELDDLEGHPPRDGLGLLRVIDDAHAPLAQDLQEAVGADALGSAVRPGEARGGGR